MRRWMSADKCQLAHATIWSGPWIMLCLRGTLLLSFSIDCSISHGLGLRWQLSNHRESKAEGGAYTCKVASCRWILLPAIFIFKKCIQKVMQINLCWQYNKQQTAIWRRCYSAKSSFFVLVWLTRIELTNLDVYPCHTHCYKTYIILCSSSQIKFTGWWQLPLPPGADPLANEIVCAWLIYSQHFSF